VKVCILTETFHPVTGGGETQARLLAEGLCAGGHEVLLVTRRSDARLPGEDRLGSVAVKRVWPSGRGQLRKWCLVLSCLPVLLRMRRRYDLVLVSGFRILGIPAMIASRLLGKCVVLKADCEGELSGEFFAQGLARFGISLQAWPLRALIRSRNALFRRADAWVAINSNIAGEIYDARFDRSRVHRIPNSVDTGVFRPADAARKRELRQRLRLPLDALIVVYTGRLVTYKGVLLLADIWPSLVARYPGAVLLLVGTGGLDMHACEDQLRDTVRKSNSGRNIMFTGSVENVHEYLQAADAFAFPTEVDAFPSSVIEAMATALPVVATPVGVIAELIQHGENGLLIPRQDGRALMQAIERLFADPALARRLGLSAWQTAQGGYSTERVTQRYAELFARVIDQRRARQVRNS
jgi:glycosyltransferase involved in cell wall biosynthesis